MVYGLPKFQTSLKHYLAITRPMNSLSTGLSIALITSMFMDWKTSLHVLIIGSTTGFLGSASAMVINDYVDRNVDAINKPWKPVPKGLVKPSILVYLGLAMYLTIIAINAPLGYLTVLTVIVYASTSIAYSFLRRFWWSQLIVPFSTTSPLIYSYVLSGFPKKFLEITIILSLSVYSAMLGREVIKAIQDVEGDRRVGYRTIPLRFGFKTSKSLILSTSLIAVTLNYAATLYAKLAPLYLILISIANAIYIRGVHRAVKIIGSRSFNPLELEDSRRKTLYASIIGLISYSTLNPPILKI